MIEFHAERPVWSDSLDLYARQQINGKTQFLVADGIKAVEIEQGLMAPKFLELTLLSDGAQSLFDALWRVGFRPNKGESSAAHVEALKYHLEDMRALVFKVAAKQPLQGTVK